MNRLKQQDAIAENRKKMTGRRNNCRANAVTFLLLAFHILIFTPVSFAAIFDRVAAFVDNQAITISELQEQYRKALKVSPDITEDDVINTMINRLLLLREAKKYRIEAPSPEEIVKEYVDLKVRALITVAEPDIEEFYHKNISRFSERNYDDVRAEIEEYLSEKELNGRLKETLKELRKKAYIKIQLNP